MKITAKFEVYYITSDIIEISEEINPADFDDKEDEIYHYIRNIADEKARKLGYYFYDEPDMDCVYYDNDSD